MTGTFLSRLHVEKVVGGWVLIDPLSYYSPMLKETITVPMGFLTDFASVPRMPFVFLLFGDVAHEAAVIHDYLYNAHWLSRREADGVLLEALEAAGVSWWRRWPMWAAVRVFGGAFFGGR